MLVPSIILFVVAAGLGLFLAVTLFKNKETPKAVVLAHGGFGALGLVLLLLYTLQNPNRLLQIAVGLLVVAAVGGFVLFANDLRKKPGPIFLVVVHAVAALVAVGLVLLVAKG